ncbi:MAG: GHKL domain-containing protein [Lachnospiraceae bacterium]|nr:GHKL domain-containing protein [Lachnospiraceae bacterium]
MKPLLIIGAIVAIAAIAAAAVWGIRKLIYHIIDRRIANFQSSLIEKQMTETENMYRQMRGWRHDYRNHIQNMKILLAAGNYSELDSYMDELARDLITVDTVIKTGNVMADAVLNAKLYAAKEIQARISVKANIPKNLPMSDVELCAILGNLLDNAVESCARIPAEERFIRVFIGVIKGQFYLSVQNAAGEMKKRGTGYLSTKRDGEAYGYGLFRIDRIANKYKGFVNRQSETGVFATELTFPIADSEETVGAK